MAADPPRHRVAVLGAGMIGAVHRASAIAAGAEVVGVLASSPDRSRQVAADWRVDTAYSSLSEVLRDSRTDVVHICTPNATHVPFAEAALRAGKHVICEKPLGISVAEVESLAALAHESGLVAAVPFVYRYHPLVREIRHRAAAGEFGRWHLVHGHYLQDWMLSPDATGWRVDPDHGGRSRAFADIGSHWCDLVEWVADIRIGELLAVTDIAVGQRPDPAAGGHAFSDSTGDSTGDSAGESAARSALVAVRTEDTAALLFRTTDGVLGTATISQLAAGRKNRLWFELDGSAGSAVFDQENPESIWLGAPESSRILVRDPAFGSPEQRRLSKLPGGHPQGYAQCFEAFVADTYAAIDGRIEMGLPTFADGLRAARITDAVLRSARTNSWTKV